MDTNSCSSGSYPGKFHPPTSHPRPQNLMTESASQDLQPDEAQPEVPVIKGATQQTKNRGAHTSVAGGVLLRRACVGQTSNIFPFRVVIDYS